MDNQEKHPGGRPPHFDKPEKLMKAFLEYVDKCQNPVTEFKDGISVEGEKKPLTVSGFCNYVKSYKEMFYEYSKKSEFSQTIKKIRSIIENDIEVGILTNKYNSIAGIFNLKNNFGWKDKTEVAQTGPDGGPVSIVLDNKQSSV